MPPHATPPTPTPAPAWEAWDILRTTLVLGVVAGVLYGKTDLPWLGWLFVGMVALPLLVLLGVVVWGSVVGMMRRL